jgi:hypothetical protein
MVGVMLTKKEVDPPQTNPCQFKPPGGDPQSALEAGDQLGDLFDEEATIRQEFLEHVARAGRLVVGRR